MPDATFLSWLSFEGRHLALADALERWCAANRLYRDVRARRICEGASEVRKVATAGQTLAAQTLSGA